MADSIGADLWIGSPYWFGTKAIVESRINTDATPEEVDLLGPILHEPVSTPDRSAKITAFGLAVD